MLDGSNGSYVLAVAIGGWWWQEGLIRAEGRSIEITPRLMMHIDGIISGKKASMCVISPGIIEMYLTSLI